MKNKIDQLIPSNLEKQKKIKLYNLLKVNHHNGMDRFYGVIAPTSPKGNNEVQLSDFFNPARSRQERSKFE